MEEVVFPRPEITKLLKSFVRVRLYTDDEKNMERSARNRKLQEERFQTSALPLYVILSPLDQVLAQFEGMAWKPEEFENFLKSGLAAAAKPAPSPAKKPFDLEGELNDMLRTKKAE